MIRKATLQDLPEIIKLLEYILGLHHEFRPDLYKEKGSKYSILELKEKLDCGELLIWVAEINNQVVGHLIAKFIDEKETLNTYPHKSLYVDDLCVHPDYQHQHLGHELLKQAKEFALLNNCYNMTLHVTKENEKAIRFYTKEGFGVQSYTMEEIL